MRRLALFLVVTGATGLLVIACGGHGSREPAGTGGNPLAPTTEPASALEPFKKEKMTKPEKPPKEEKEKDKDKDKDDKDKDKDK